MKKNLLSLTFLLIATLTFAQVGVRNANNLSTTYQKKVLNGNEYIKESTPEQTYSPVRTMSRNFIGTTLYDCQTNGSMSNRVLAHSDGTVSAFWTTMGYNAQSRGTGYNYFDNGQWLSGAGSNTRIENTRTGWGTATSVGNAEIVVAHDGNHKLIISICPEKGTNQWTFSELVGPTITNTSNQTRDALLWPAIAASGNTIHLIACTDSDQGFLYQGIQTCLLYYRGQFDAATNTITWEEPRVVGDVTADEVSQFGGDSYAIAAKGDNVAIVALPPFLNSDAFLWKSTDGGVNFTKTIFSEGYKTAGDTAYHDDGSLAVAIGDDGLAHVAFGAYLAYKESDSATTYTWYPGVGEIIYWNETMEPITRSLTDDQTYKDPEVLLSKGYGVFEQPELNCDDNISGVNWGIEAYPNYGCAAVSMPQLVAEGGNVYLVYSANMEFPFLDIANTKYYRGIFAAKSTDNGANFGEPSWMSYNKDLYYMNSWEIFPLGDSTTLGECREFLDTESENVYPVVAKNLVNGDIKMIWQMDYDAGSYVKDTTEMKESFLYYFQMNADSIGIYNNIHEVCQGLWIDPTGISNQTISGMKLYPNPASNSVNVTFSSEESGEALVTIMNIMGQTVKSETVAINEGYNKLNLGISNLKSGVYMINIKTNRGTSTQKLIVK